MDKINKKELSETDICDNYITPSIYSSGWKPIIQVRREVTLSPGPIIVRKNFSSRNKKKMKRADYVLYLKPGIPIGVVEAKDNNHAVSDGIQQALNYSELLDVPSVYSSNGDAFAFHNKVATSNENIEGEIKLENFPEHEDLVSRYKIYKNIDKKNEDIFFQNFNEDFTDKELRYYQLNVINKATLEIIQNKKRLLVVMATGTGKTFTIFQILWRLWKAKKIKRALFLVDRNSLADQTINNDFKPFGKVLTKIKNRKIDPSYEIHVGLYQSLTGPDEKDKAYKTVSRNFFDLVVIDECHRGSANEDSTWKEILEYFDSAIHLGMTATPKETKYASNINYFGDPIYTYSLKQGIEEGFLAPYKVIKVDLDRDIEGWIPPPGMKDDLGQTIEKKYYNQADMDKTLVLNKRTKIVAKRLMEYLRATDPYSKTIVFCEDIDHAERMRVAISNEAKDLVKKNHKYVVRITGDSKVGKEELENFTDNKEKYPVIATTSELMSTGIDAQTCKLIVLDKTINSMTLFKQIIGRGTRIQEKFKKFFFTIIDFKNATDLFKDPDFDGEPVIIYNPDEGESIIPPEEDEIIDPEDDDENEGIKKIVVSGVEVKILNERVEYYGESGNLITESYKDFSKKIILNKYRSLDHFLSTWTKSSKKIAIINELKEIGIDFDILEKEVGLDIEPFDLILHLAFAQKPLTRSQRVKNLKRKPIFEKYQDQAKLVLTSLLNLYEDKNIESLEDIKVLNLPKLKSIGSPIEIVENIFHGKENYDNTIIEIENELYNSEENVA